MSLYVVHNTVLPQSRQPVTSKWAMTGLGLMSIVSLTKVCILGNDKYSFEFKILDWFQEYRLKSVCLGN